MRKRDRFSLNLSSRSKAGKFLHNLLNSPKQCFYCQQAIQAGLILEAELEPRKHSINLSAVVICFNCSSKALSVLNKPWEKKTSEAA